MILMLILNSKNYQTIYKQLLTILLTLKSTIMKKILFVALAASLMAVGCQMTEIINPVGNPIGFSAEMQKLTKAATADGEANLQTQNFKVWAYTAYTDVTNNVAPGTVYDKISALDVTYENPNWGTVLQYYWPGADKDLDFFAVSTGKFSLTEGAPTVTIAGMGGTLGGRTLTVSGYAVNNDDANDDLMVAEFVRQNQGKNQKVVDLNFKHALSKVIFQFKTNSVEAKAPIVHVTDLSINDVVTTGTLTVKESSTTLTENSDGTRVAVDLEWTLAETKASIAESFTENNQLTTTAAPYVTKLLMPQGLNGKKLTVNYTITEPVEGAKPRAFSIDFDLSAATVNSWGINQAITYTIALSPNTITFNPTVAPWETVNEDTSMSN